MGIKEMSVGRSDLFRLDPRILQEEPNWNARTPGKELDEHIRCLANSIAAIGVQEPLKVVLKNDIPYVRSGHCRLAATMLAISEGADIKSVPVSVIPKTYSEADIVLSMITGNEGKPLSILEQAEVYKRLIGFGWSNSEIACKTGYTSAHIGNCLLLGAAKEEIKALVRENKVAASLAIKLIMELGEDKALETMKGAVESAKAEGKKKATKKDTDADKRKTSAAKEKAANWRKWGPKLRFALEAIVTCPIKSSKLGQYISDGNMLLQEIEDEIGEIQKNPDVAAFLD